MISDEGKFLLKVDEKENTISYPTAEIIGMELEYTYLFSIDDEDFFFLNSGQESTNPEGFEFYDMRALRKDYLYPKHYVFAAYTAYQLIEWYEGTKYCGRLHRNRRDP